MPNMPLATEVLGAMITPAVLISAAGTLVLSTSNRLNRVVDRVRILVAQAERLGTCEGLAIREPKTGRQLIAEQLAVLSSRVLLLRSAMTALYLAIGLLVATSIAVGVVAAFHWVHGWIPVVSGLMGTCVLLYASFLLVREARLAVGMLLQEMTQAREAVIRELD
jgi:hypothetical protein